MKLLPNMNKLMAAAVAVMVVGMSAKTRAAGIVTTDSFDGFTMDFVEIGETGNANDDTGYGSVDYTYRIGRYAVSEVMVDTFNANSGGPNITIDERGDDKPATSVDWIEAARFVNYLNTSQGYQAAYLFADGDINTEISLWSSEEAWQLGGENLYRHKDAHYFLPSEDEWYKAAYFDGNSMLYYDYATGSDTPPAGVSSGSIDGTAVYGQSGPADTNLAGGLSPYGTMGQNGNVDEWSESAYDGGNSSATESRVFRGGYWGLINTNNLQSSSRILSLPPNSGYETLGFRVASIVPIPEPSSLALLALGGVAVLLRRKRSP